MFQRKTQLITCTFCTCSRFFELGDVLECANCGACRALK